MAPAGNRQLAPKAEDVDPEAVTDDEEPPAGRVTQGNAKPALQPVAIAAKALNGIKPAPSQVRITASISLDSLRCRIISPTMCCMRQSAHTPYIPKAQCVPFPSLARLKHGRQWCF